MNNGQKAAVGIGVAAGLGMVVYLLARPAKAAPPPSTTPSSAAARQGQSVRPHIRFDNQPRNSWGRHCADRRRREHCVRDL